MTTVETPRATMNGKPVFRVPVKTVLNLNSGFEKKLLCDGPALALGDACAYDCSFCYVPAIYQKLDRVKELLAREGKKHHEVVILREAAIETLVGQLYHPGGKRKFPDSKDRRTVYASPADDVAANLDLVKATVEACKVILTATFWSIRLLSKSNLLPEVAARLCDWADSPDGKAQDLSSLHVRNRMIFGFSTGTLDDKLARAFEGGTPLVSRRIKALHMLQDNGFRTFGMICPSLPQSASRINTYDQFAREMADALRPDRMEHVWAEVINLRGESFKRTFAALRDGGFAAEAHAIDRVAHDRDAWHFYNQATFLAHAAVYSKWVGKLRYLTYVDDVNRGWWQKQIAKGAVLL